jgi:predicted dehydrogenase
MIRLGVIGYGGRARGVLGHMGNLNAGTQVVAIADPRCEELKTSSGLDANKVAFYSDADEMLGKEQLDGVLVGTRCHLHAPMGIKVLERNIPIFLEKPIATNVADLLALKKAGEGKSGRVVVSFPLRVTPLVQLAKEIIESGQVGTIEHVQAWNNVNYGKCYYQEWYRDENETQGLWLQKATQMKDDIRMAALDLGVALAHSGRYEEALVSLKRAVELDPGQLDAHYQLGRVYQQMGKRAEAQQEFAKARALRKEADEDSVRKMSSAPSPLTAPATPPQN